MGRWNEVRKTNLSDFTREQASEKGKPFLKVWESHREFQREEKKKIIKRQMKTLLKEVESE